MIPGETVNMMKLRMESTLTMLLVLGCHGETRDGGKIPWRGKGAGDDVKAIMAEAREEGKAIMLFFTSKG